jgi:hypothetical protein
VGCEYLYAFAVLSRISSLPLFHLPGHWNINEPPPGLSRLQQRPSRPQPARSGTRGARSSEEESDGEHGVFALGMWEEARCSGAG